MLFAPSSPLDRVCYNFWWIFGDNTNGNLPKRGKNKNRSFRFDQTTPSDYMFYFIILYLFNANSLTRATAFFGTYSSIFAFIFKILRIAVELICTKSVGVGI